MALKSYMTSRVRSLKHLHLKRWSVALAEALIYLELLVKQCVLATYRKRSLHEVLHTLSALHSYITTQRPPPKPLSHNTESTTTTSVLAPLQRSPKNSMFPRTLNLRPLQRADSRVRRRAEGTFYFLQAPFLSTIEVLGSVLLLSRGVKTSLMVRMQTKEMHNRLIERIVARRAARCFEGSWFGREVVQGCEFGGCVGFVGLGYRRVLFVSASLANRRNEIRETTNLDDFLSFLPNDVNQIPLHQTHSSHTPAPQHLQDLQRRHKSPFPNDPQNPLHLVACLG